MKKTLVTVTTIAVVGFGSALFGTTAHADNLENLQQKQTQIQNERSNIKSNLSEAEGEIADILIDLEKLNKEIEEVNTALKNNQKMMNQTENDIADTQNEVDLLEEEIVELEESIEKRYDILKERIVSYQKSGGNIKYLEVIFGSKSFGDLISRVAAVNKITESDQALMDQQEEDKEKVEAKQAKVLTKLDELNDMKAELENIISLIEDQKKQNEKKKNSLETKEKDLLALKEKLEIEDSKLVSLEAEVKQKIEAATRPAPPVSQAASGEKSGKSGNLTALSKSSDQSSSGYFAWPAVGGYISSYVGPRWGRTHKGIDIARPSNYNILAAADGVVSSAGHSGSFGNKIEIKHSNGLKTLYAHLSSINVKVGQSVGKGAKIGVMGATGNSTGIHLHFEVYKNGALQNPMDYLK